MRHVIRRHKYKLAIGIPIVVLIASTIGFSSTADMLGFQPAKRFLAVGATTTVSVTVSTKTPINAVGGTVVLPEELKLLDSSVDETIINLWTIEPKAQEGDTSIEFSGGIISPDGFVGDGTVLHFTVEALGPGTGEILFAEPEILAHDGRGTNVLQREQTLRFVIRPENEPSPDLNQDNRVSVVDVALVSRKLFGKYDRDYDLNLDGKVTLADIILLIQKLGK